MRLEHALFVDLDRDLEALERSAAVRGVGLRSLGWSRLYVGSESCEHRLPSPTVLERGLAYCSEEGLDLTLVTPPSTDAALGLLAELVARVPTDTEVVVNDWGVLDVARDRRCAPIFGRALNRLVHDPRIEPEGLSAGLRRFSRQSLLHAPRVQAFLRDQGFVRAELENVPQGLDPLPGGALQTSLHFPHMLVAIGRHCGARFARRCPGRPCFDSATSVSQAPLLFDGIASYALQPTLPSDLGSLACDRLVRQVGPEGVGWLTGDGTPEAWSRAHARRLERGGSGRFVDSVEDDLVAALAEGVDSVFEAGCGNGETLAAFASLGKRVLGVDVSPVAAEEAKRRLGSDAVVVGDFLRERIPGTFDLVLDLGSGHAIPPDARRAWLDGIRSVLAEDGMVLAAWFERDPRLNPAEPVYLLDGTLPEWGFTEEDLNAALSPDLERVWTRRVPADRECPARWQFVFARSGRGRERALEFTERLRRRTERVGLPPAPPESMAAHRSHFPETGTSQEWLTAGDVARLASRGFDLVDQRIASDGRLSLHVLGGRRPIALDLVPLPARTPHYATLGAYQVTYHGKATRVEDVDRLMEALADCALLWSRR